MKFYTSSQIKQIESNASADISYLQMMENAGYGCAGFIAARAARTNRIVCLCGKGKNGGDGLVASRYLAKGGFNVTVAMLQGIPTAGDPLINYKKAAALQTIPILDFGTEPDKVLAAIRSADIIIDAIFGFGFAGAFPASLASAVLAVNESNGKVFSVDVPSGAECDTGKVEGLCVKADYTLAVTYRKPCHLLYPAAEMCGEVVLIKIGIKKSHSANVEDAGFFSLPKDGSGIMLPKRNPISNKGDYGRVLSICGSKKYPGAAVLAANGSVKAGAGLVLAAFPDAAYPAVSSKLTEPVLLPCPSSTDGFMSRAACGVLEEEIKRADVITIGCGLGQTIETRELFGYVLTNSTCPLVIDADGINLLKDFKQLVKLISPRAVLTPHPGELGRLINAPVETLQSKRIELASAMSKKLGTVIVIKGANTIVASPNDLYINATGNAGMACGGTGDLLSGIIAGLIGQGLDIFHAAVSGVYIHGLAGDAAAEKYSVCSMTPTDMLNELPGVMKKCERSRADKH